MDISSTVLDSTKWPLAREVCLFIISKRRRNCRALCNHFSARFANNNALHERSAIQIRSVAPPYRPVDKTQGIATTFSLLRFPVSSPHPPLCFPPVTSGPPLPGFQLCIPIEPYTCRAAPDNEPGARIVTLATHASRRRCQRTV